MDNLKRLQNEYEIIDDVRGIGLFQGIELIRDNATKEPADHEAHFIVNRMRQRGILMSHDGPFHNVLKIKPPMCFTKENVDFLVSELSGVLDELQLFT